jgi:cytochrome c
MRLRGNARAWAGWATVAALAALLTAGCADLPIARPAQVTVGEPEFGRQSLIDYGCISCHTIPGIPAADAYVGPPLDHWGLRSYIAGSLTNDLDNLVLWIMNPQAVEPGTAMPNLYVTEGDAINMAAYLLSLD